MSELERISKEEEDVELARQANELNELARQQEAEILSQSPAPEATPTEEIAAPVEESAPAPESSETPAVVEEPAAAE